MNAIKIERDATTGAVTMTPLTLTTKNYFEEMQRICKGYIGLAGSYKGERAKRGSQASLDVWVNDNGIAEGMSPTVQVVDPRQAHDPLFGPLVIVAAGKPYGKPRDMTDMEKASIVLVEDGQGGMRLPKLTVGL